METSALELATNNTMPCLSAGWSGIVVGMWGIGWISAMLLFCDGLTGRTTQLVGAGVMTLVSLLIAWPLAQTSTQCSNLIDHLNKQRMFNLALHERLTALETALRQHNMGKGKCLFLPAWPERHASESTSQSVTMTSAWRRCSAFVGLGFVVGGIVVDTRLLSQAFLGVFSILSTVIPMVILLRPGDPTACSLTDLQVRVCLAPFVALACLTTIALRLRLRCVRTESGFPIDGGRNESDVHIQYERWPRRADHRPLAMSCFCRSSRWMGLNSATCKCHETANGLARDYNRTARMEALARKGRRVGASQAGASYRAALSQLESGRLSRTGTGLLL